MNNFTLGQRVHIKDSTLRGSVAALFYCDRHPYALVALDDGFYGFEGGQQVAYITKLAVHQDNLEAEVPAGQITN